MIEKTPTPHHQKNAALPFSSYGKQCPLRVTYYKCNRQQLIFASIQSRVPAPRFESRKKIATLLTTARKGHNYIGHQSTYPAFLRNLVQSVSVDPSFYDYIPFVYSTHHTHTARSMVANSSNEMDFENPLTKSKNHQNKVKRLPCKF